MSLQVVLEQIKERQNQIDAVGKFDLDILNKINYKFRLDWNYYSNRMEGGTLTKAETRTVMIGNVEVSGKPIKDIMEMNSHDKVVLEVLKMAKSESRISEKRIKDIHEGIMYEDDPAKKKEIGQWKSEANEIISYKGEKIPFTAPSEVIDEIHTLLNKINAELDKLFSTKPSKHPLEIASQFHIDFVCIHPFYDGNGRVSRILTNLVLISCGYPPIIIKEEHKARYHNLLADIQVYGGDSDLFHIFLGERLLESQQLMLSAINGEDIEEQDDLDKKIALLDQQFNAIGDENEIKTVFNTEIFFKIFDSSFSELAKELIPVVRRFNHFFINTKHQLIVTNGSLKIILDDDTPTTVLNDLRNTCIENKSSVTTPIRMIFETEYSTFKKGGVKPFNCKSGFVIYFKDTSYSVYLDSLETGNGVAIHNENLFTEKLLNQPLSSNEISAIVKRLGDSIYSQIEDYMKGDTLE